MGAGPQDLRAVLLDGVLYVENEPLPGAREAVAELRERGLTLLPDAPQLPVTGITSLSPRAADGSSCPAPGLRSM